MARKNIREEILNTARRLFNRQGYHAVSMRDIADALGISVGNLTYHYRRKEDLMEAVVMEMHRYYAPAPPPQNLQELNAMFARMQNNIQENAFYFWHYTQLGQAFPAIHAMQLDMVESQAALLRKALGNLQKAGLLQKEAYEGQHDELAQAIRIICVYWVPQSKLEEELNTPQDFLRCVWSVLIPVLTKEGHEVYREQILKVRAVFEALQKQGR